VFRRDRTGKSTHTYITLSSYENYTAVYAYRAVLSTKSIFEILDKQKNRPWNVSGCMIRWATEMQKYPLAIIVVDDVLIRGNRYQDIKCEKKDGQNENIDWTCNGRKTVARRIIAKTMFSFLRLLYVHDGQVNNRCCFRHLFPRPRRSAPRNTRGPIVGQEQYNTDNLIIGPVR